MRIDGHEKEDFDGPAYFKLMSTFYKTEWGEKATAQTMRPDKGNTECTPQPRHRPAAGLIL
jgi:hypothetical protein